MVNRRAAPRPSVRKLNTAVCEADAFHLVSRGVSLGKRIGTAVAKENGMLTLSTFVLAVGSVFSSVLWACKNEPADQA